MDCCGSSKPKEKDKDVNAKDVNSDQLGRENNPTEKEQTHGGGCCGGGGLGTWLHLIIMVVMFIAIWYFSGR